MRRWEGKIDKDIRILRLAEFMCLVEGLGPYKLTMKALDEARKIIDTSDRGKEKDHETTTDRP